MAKPTLVLLLLLSAAVPSDAVAADFKLGPAGVTPAKAYFGGDPVRIEFRFAAAGPADVEVVVTGPREPVRTFSLPGLEPGRRHSVEWDGLTDARKAAPDGKYLVLIGEAGSALRSAGQLVLRGHRYPVAGPHGFRGPVGDFRAGRNGGRWHHGFDVLASCGTPLVAARAGTVIVERFDGALDGHYVVIRGRKEGLSYRYSHLPRPSALDVGDRVETGDRVGVVGRSGNAASVGCHLHFEVKRAGRFVDPEPLLRAWDRYS